MAYGDKYIGQFWTHRTKELCTIKIQEQDYTGSTETLTLAEEALIISMPAKREFAGSIMGIGCQIRVLNISSDFTKYDDLFGNAERFHKVIITLRETNPITIFEGFIQPMVHRQALQFKSRFTISADNQLSGLHEYYSDLLESEYEFSKITLQELIKNILDSTGIEAPIYVKNTLFSTLYAIAFDIDVTCFDKLRVNRQVFIEQDELMDGRTILEMILKLTYSRLYYYDGKWVIDRLRDIHNTDMYKVYPFTGANFTESLAHDSFELSAEHILSGTGNLEYEAGKKKYKLIIDFDRYDNLVPSSFIHIQNSLIFDTTAKGRLPHPTLGFWQTWREVEFINKSLITEHLASGIAYTEDGLLTAAEYYYVPITSSFIVDFNVTHSINIHFAYDWSQIGAVSNMSYRGGFRLRYKTPDGDWRFLKFINESVRKGSKMTDHSQYHDLNEQNWWLQWSRPSGTTVHRWRIIDGTDDTILYQSNIFKSDSDPNLDPVYGDLLFTGVGTNVEFTAAINDPDVEEYSRIPGRPEWSIDDVSADERPAGIYKYKGYVSSAVFFDLTPLGSSYEITGAEAQDNPLQEISETLNFADIESWIIDDFGSAPEVLEMQIDIMPMHRIDHPEDDNLWEPTLNNKTYFGDVVITQNTEISNNVIEGVINEDFRGTLEKNLKIYDGNYVNYKNTLELYVDGESIKSKNWLDDNSPSGASPQKIHYLLIDNLVQQYNKPRHFIHTDLVLSDINSLENFISPGSVFTFTQLPDKQFIVVGYDYNVKMSAWRLSLMEHKDYDNFEIV